MQETALLCCRLVVIGSTGSQYIVELKDRNPTCECPDYFYRHRFCKHLWLIFMYLGMFERHQRQDWHQVTLLSFLMRANV